MTIKKKALWGELPWLVVGVLASIILLIILSNSFDLLYRSTAEAGEIDQQTFTSFKFIADEINELKEGEISTDMPYRLKSGYFIFYSNPNNALVNIKKRSQCNTKSCLCLCKDSNCKELLECISLNKRLKKSDKIQGVDDTVNFLTIKYDKDGVSIEPKQK